MESNLLEMDHKEETLAADFPTSEEAKALLREDDYVTSELDIDEWAPDSPTATMKSAIQVQIAENLNTLFTNAKCILLFILIKTPLLPPPTLNPFWPPFSQKTSTTFS